MPLVGLGAEDARAAQQLVPCDNAAHETVAAEDGEEAVVREAAAGPCAAMPHAMAPPPRRKDAQQAFVEVAARVFCRLHEIVEYPQDAVTDHLRNIRAGRIPHCEAQLEDEPSDASVWVDHKDATRPEAPDRVSDLIKEVAEVV